MTQQWISVKDRLPEPGEKVLVSIQYGLGNRDTTMSYTTKRFPDCFNHLLNDRITHWMPLPAPPGSEPDSGPVSSGTPCTFKENPDRVTPL